MNMPNINFDKSFIILLLVILSLYACKEDAFEYIPPPIEALVVNKVSPSSGDIGSLVIITGENFSSLASNNKVKFAGASAVVQEVSSTELQVIVPEGAVTGDLTVSTSGQTVVAGVFMVVDIPVISGFSPAIGAAGDTITINGSKFGDSISDVEVQFNGESASVITVSESSIAAIIPEGATSGSISVTVNGQSTSSSNELTVATLLRIAIEREEDDVEEVAVDFGEPVGTMDLESSDLELGEISSDQGLMNIGLRFNKIAIPQDVEIISAYIQFRCDNTGTDPVELTIFGEATGHSLPYTAEIGNLSKRNVTNKNVVWSVAAWLFEGERAEAQRTEDISQIVQELVDRSDWSSGNSMNFILKNTGVSAAASSSSGGREAENYSSSKPDDNAELTIIYK